MYVKKTGYVIACKEGPPPKIKKSKDSWDMRKFPYPYYQVLCDENACENCLEHQGKIFSTPFSLRGVNLPPFHPNCKCTIIGRYHNGKMDPWAEENALWDFLLSQDLPLDYQIQLLRNFYSLSEEDYSDTQLEINLLSAKIDGADQDETIQQFKNRLDPNWTSPNLDTLFSYPWNSEYVTDPFKQKVADIAKIIGVPPDDLMKVMASESRLDPTSKNEAGAVGLIQFTDLACQQIGTTRAALSDMSAVQQLDYVYRYFKGSAGKMDDAVDLYWATCTNKTIGKGDYDVVFDGNNPNEKGLYEGNKGMDHDDDDKITRRDLREHLEIQLEEYWKNWAKKPESDLS